MRYRYSWEFGWVRKFTLKDRLIHFFLCNKPFFDGCSGHKVR